jgi:hypothetical protein
MRRQREYEANQLKLERALEIRVRCCWARCCARWRCCWRCCTIRCCTTRCRACTVCGAGGSARRERASVAQPVCQRAWRRCCSFRPLALLDKPPACPGGPGEAATLQRWSCAASCPSKCCHPAAAAAAAALQDGQLASFMAVAHRQIKFLEDQCKALQKVAL